MTSGHLLPPQRVISGGGSSHASPQGAVSQAGEGRWGFDAFPVPAISPNAYRCDMRG